MQFLEQLYFNPEVKVGDIVSFISLILSIIGASLALCQWSESIKTKRAEYIDELTQTIRTDEDIKDIVYLFDYDEEKRYTIEFHNGGDLERKVDKTLSYFSYICYLRHQRLIRRGEFKFFKYEIDRIIANSQVQDYLYNLYHFSKENHDPMTFDYLFKYRYCLGKRLLGSLFHKGFFDKTSKKYPHYLNF